MNKKSIEQILTKGEIDHSLRAIAKKVLNEQRITLEEGVTLFEKGELSFLGTLANHVKEKKNGNYVYFNRNFHVEPTNICVFDCKFCSYSKKLREKGIGETWKFFRERRGRRRRKTIADINKSNDIFSRKLNESKCVVPSMTDIYKFNDKVSKLKRVVSTRN